MLRTLLIVISIQRKNTTENNEIFSSIIDSCYLQAIIDASREYQEWLDSNPDDERENYQEHLNNHRNFVAQIVVKVNKT